MDQAVVTYPWDLLFVAPLPPSLRDGIANWELEGPDWVSPVPISWRLAVAVCWSLSFHVAERENWMNRKASDSPPCSRILEEWPAWLPTYSLTFTTLPRAYGHVGRQSWSLPRAAPAKSLLSHLEEVFSSSVIFHQGSESRGRSLSLCLLP